MEVGIRLEVCNNLPA